MSNNNHNVNSDLPDDLKELKKAWEALQESQRKNTPVAKKPVSPKSKAPQMVPLRIKVNSPKNRGLLGRFIHHVYVQTTCGGVDPETPTCKTDGMDIETAIQLAAQGTYLSSDAYQRQQMVDQIAQNQEELTKRTIEQGMTWLYPRFEYKLEDILNELKKK